MELKGLSLVQNLIDRPSDDDAADKEVQSMMRSDGFVEIETFISVEMLMAVWPAVARGRVCISSVPEPSGLVLKARERFTRVGTYV